MQQSLIMQEDAQALLLDISLSSNKKVHALLNYCTRKSKLTLLYFLKNKLKSILINKGLGITVV